MKMEQAECSETYAHKIQTPGYHPKERLKHPQHGEYLQSKTSLILCVLYAISTSLFLILSVTGAVYEVHCFQT